MEKYFFKTLKEIPQKRSLLKKLPASEIDTPTIKPKKEYNLWDLKQLWSKQPAVCIAQIEALQAKGENDHSLDSLKKLAIGRLIEKSAYYYQTSDCAKGKQLFDLAIQYGVKTNKFQAKELDFYAVRCSREAGNYTEALQLLKNMEEKYQHQLSILLAKADILHNHQKKYTEASALYEELRYLYQSQKADIKFIQTWQSEKEEFTLGKLLSEYAQIEFKLENSEKGKRLAIESVKLDSTQTLAYELIAKQLHQEEKDWGACKYWAKAAENGSAEATELLLKHCK